MGFRASGELRQFRPEHPRQAVTSGRGALGRRVGQGLTILRSKTDQEGKGAVVAVTPACLRALDAIRPENPGDGDRVFRLSIRQMANRIKDAVAAAGFDGQVRVLRRETPSDPQSELRQKTHA